MARGVVFAGILVEAVVDGVPPVVRLLARKGRGKQGNALEGAHVFRGVRSCCGNDGGSVVDVLHHGGIADARGNFAGPSHDEGHAERFLKNPALVVHAVFAHVETLVAAVDDQRVFGKAFLVQVFHEASDAVVHGKQAAQVVFHVGVPFPFREGFRVFQFSGFHAVHQGLGALGVVIRPGLPFFRGHAVDFAQVPAVAGGDDALAHLFRHLVLEHLEVGINRHVPGYGLLVFLQEFRAVGVVVMEVGGRRQLGRVHLAQMAQGGAPGAVGGLVAHDEQERLVLVPVFQPLDGFVRDHVRGIAGKALRLAFPVRLEADEIRIVVAALSGEDFPRVKAGGV